MDLVSACAKLASRRRAAVILRYYEDRPYREIAEVLDCEVSSARSLVSRGISDLRHIVGHSLEVEHE